jgi:hypothetical protein
MPMPRKSTSAGTPRLSDRREAATLASIRSEPMRSRGSIGIVNCIVRTRLSPIRESKAESQPPPVFKEEVKSERILCHLS